MYLQCRPAAALAPHIELLWLCEGYQGTHRRERVLPSGKFQLILDLAPGAGPSILLGMSTGYTILETANLQSLVGVVFRPGGAGPFFDIPADALANGSAPLDLLWGSRAAAVRDRLLETVDAKEKLRIVHAELLARLTPPWELHAAVRHAVSAFRHDSHTRAIHEIAREAGLSRRRFADLFREQVGLPPKLYCRLIRFQNVVSRASAGGEIDWVEVALAGGYYDQSHMAHEFRAFSGVSPGAWLASDRPFRNHAILD